MYSSSTALDDSPFLITEEDALQAIEKSPSGGDVEPVSPACKFNVKCLTSIFHLANFVCLFSSGKVALHSLDEVNYLRISCEVLILQPRVF